METDTRRQFKSRMDAKQDVWRAVPALMGNGSGVVEVPNQPGYVYIRTSANDLGQAFNNRCPLYDNLAIYCGYDPITDPDRRIFQVLSVRMTDYANAGNTPILNIPNHHLYHEFGGGDDVYVDWRRLLGFRVGRPAAFVVTIDPGVMMRAGAWIALTAQTVNLAASKPGGVNSARYTLIALDNTGTITTTDGAIVSAPLLDISDCPVPAAGEIPLAAVRLYSTQTQINDTPGTPDIIDLRFPTTYTTGGSNVYGSGVANQFAYWSAADTLASSAEVIRQTNTCLVATKSVAALAPATYYTGLFSNATVAAAVAQAGHLLSVVSHLTAAGAADYTGDLVGYNGVGTLSGTGTSSAVKGYDYTLQLTAAGTATEAMLFQGAITAGGAGTITTGYGYRLLAPAGSIGTFYGVHIATLAAATNKWAFYSVGDKITTKGAAAAGIELDPNAATGNFTLSLSPMNLTGNRRHILPNYDVTWPAADAVGVLTSNGAGVLSWGAAGGAHELLSATHTDTLADNVVDGDVIIGNVTPAWSRLAIAIPAVNVRNVLGIDNGELRPAWKTALDGTNPTTIAEGAAAAPGTSLIFSHRDHTHGAPATWAATAHNLLSATHGDTTPAACVRGDLVTGQGAPPTWTRLPVSVDSGAILTTDGTDVFWSDYLMDGNGSGITYFNVTAGKTLQFDCVDDYTLTIPATGTAALLGIANAFTANQTITTTDKTYNYNIFYTLNTATSDAGSYSAGNWISRGILSEIDLTHSTAGSAEHHGITSIVRYRGTQSSANAFSRDVNVFRGSGFVYNTGTVGVVDGFALDMRNLGTGTVTTMSGIHVPAMTNSGGGTITTTYGVKVDALGVGSTRYAFWGNNASAANVYNLYMAGTAANYLGGALTVAGAFGCNAAAAQTAYASGGALAAYGAGANGYDTAAHASELHAMVVKIRAALVANGIMS